MHDITWQLVLGFVIIAILYLTYEQIYLKKIRKSFKYIIHVNGTRGKSTVCRLLDSVLREAGFRVFTKTTGTLPIMILPDKKQIEIKRLGRANIREQIKMIKRAYQEKAEILILECMAVDPNLQWHSEAHILRSNISVITNARHDHLLEMGSSIAEIINSLANTIPNNSIVINGDIANRDIWENIAKQKACEIIFADQQVKDNSLTSLKINKNIVAKIAEYLGIKESVALSGMAKYLPDPGAFQIIQLQQLRFINCFSTNDPDSTKAIYDDLIKSFNSEDITFLVNNRADRPERTIQNINLIRKLKPKKIIITGDNINYVKKKVSSVGEVIIYKDFNDLASERIVFAFGNIANQGFKILNECIKRRDLNEC